MSTSSESSSCSSSSKSSFESSDTGVMSSSYPPHHQSKHKRITTTTATATATATSNATSSTSSSSTSTSTASSSSSTAISNVPPAISNIRRKSLIGTSRHPYDLTSGAEDDDEEDYDDHDDMDDHKNPEQPDKNPESSLLFYSLLSNNQSNALSLIHQNQQLQQQLSLKDAKLSEFAQKLRNIADYANKAIGRHHPL